MEREGERGREGWRGEEERERKRKGGKGRGREG